MIKSTLKDGSDQKRSERLSGIKKPDERAKKGGCTMDQVGSFIERVSAAHDIDGIYDTLGKTLEDLGFERFAYLIIHSPLGPQEHLYLGTYPQDWSEHYFERDYVHVDPVMAAAGNGVIPFTWHALRQGQPRGARAIRMLDEAGDFGLRNGITVPIHGPGKALATLNVASDVSAPEFKEMWTERRHALHLIALYAHEAIVRQTFSDAGGWQPHLSPRERECLAWASRGKTSWETSRVLGLSETTVLHYLNTAAIKLNVHSKTHAVVKAMLLGLIVPYDFQVAAQH